MNDSSSNRAMKAFRFRLSAIHLVVFAAVLAACADDVDPRFAPETQDEYTQPLVNAVIGTPEGIILMPAAPDEGAAIAVAADDGGIDGTGGAGIDGGSGGGSGRGGGIGSTGGRVGASTGGRVGVGGGAVGSTGGSGRGGGIGSTGGVVGTGGRVGAGGRGGAGGAIGSGGTGGNEEGGIPGSGFWHFDDCSARSHFLIDSSGFGANAQQALNAACEPGISNLGVRIRSARDIIQVPDEPQFTVSNRVAVAAWVHPDFVTGNQPIVIKRLGNQTSFSLGIHNGNIEMSVVLTTGRTFISRAPISPGVWTHVGGMYDGTFVFLFINGQQFGQVFAGGTLRNVFAPLRFGATSQTQFFRGVIDDVFISTEDISKDVITSLSCISQPSTFTVTPEAGGPVSFDTNVHYDVTVTDHDSGTCGPRDYNFFLNFFESGITANIDSSFQVAFPGESVTFGVDVSGSEDAEPGLHQIPFFTNSFSPNFEQLAGQLSFELTPPTDQCFVFRKRELMITSTSVVDDPVRTSGNGAWTLGHLLREMAPTEESAPAFALQLFQHWLTDQTVNGFTVPARPAAQQLILDAWPKTPTGELDLDQPPFRLQAIVNRFDLGDLSAGSAGQGRIVFALNAFGFFPQPFTVILEYNLPATTEQDVVDWANRWHALSSHPFPSEEYNAALEEITRRLTERNAAPDRVNGSDLLQLRTNENTLNFRWELREFELSPTTGLFDQATVKETPDLGFNGTSTFANFVNQNEEAIINVIPGSPTLTVPLMFEGRNFLTGSVFNDLILWSAPGISNPDARFHASLNTCNGCHGPETGTRFLMINPRFPFQEAALSPFLTGVTVFDPFDNFRPRTINDLARRRDALSAVVCP